MTRICVHLCTVRDSRITEKRKKISHLFDQLHGGRLRPKHHFLSYYMNCIPLAFLVGARALGVQPAPASARLPSAPGATRASPLRCDGCRDWRIARVPGSYLLGLILVE